jgi:hypothetical protein
MPQDCCENYGTVAMIQPHVLNIREAFNRHQIIDIVFFDADALREFNARERNRIAHIRPGFDE